MSTMRRFPVALLASMTLLSLLAATPASAHLLKVFATVEDGAITGYGFFVGGGRPQGAQVTVRDGDGKEVWAGKTDEEGRYTWHPPKASNFTIVIDTREGHIAEGKIAANRFGDSSEAALVTDGGQGALAQPTGGGVPAGDAAALAAMIDKAVDKAVSRQVRPLLEAYEAAENRLRLNDIVGGIGMIIGLAGLAMWAFGRRGKAT